MSALQLLSSYLAEVVKEILRVVEDTVTEYREEAARTRRENQTLRSQLRDMLLLEARAEWPRAGPIPSFSLEQLSLSENSASAVTPPTRRSVPAPQEPVVFLDAQQDSEDKPECTDRKQLLFNADAHGKQAERTAAGPRASAETPAPVRVKEEPEERSLTESDQEESDHRAECCRNTEEDEAEADEEDGAQWRRDKDDEGGDWRDPEPGLRPKPEPEPPSATRTEPPQTTVPQACPEPHSAPRCPRCSETFPSPVALLQHLHQQKKTHRCHFCCKSFSQSADLRRHHRTHTGERPHRCSFCSRAFSQRGNLRRHLRIHTGERPYACTHCLRRFSDGDTLKKHLRTHGPAQSGLSQD